MKLTAVLVAQIEEALQHVAERGFGSVAIVIEHGKPKWVEERVSAPAADGGDRPPPPGARQGV